MTIILTILSKAKCSIALQCVHDRVRLSRASRSLVCVALSTSPTEQSEIHRLADTLWLGQVVYCVSKVCSKSIKLWSLCLSHLYRFKNNGKLGNICKSWKLDKTWRSAPGLYSRSARSWIRMMQRFGLMRDDQLRMITGRDRDYEWL